MMVFSLYKTRLQMRRRLPIYATRSLHISMLLRLISLFALAVASRAAHAPGQLSVLVTFGDSYTDTVAVSNNGTQWPVYAAGYANATLYPYARSGAPCSQALTPRPFPAVNEDEIPLYMTEKANGSLTVPPKDTLYTLWIGGRASLTYMLVSTLTEYRNRNE